MRTLGLFLVCVTACTPRSTVFEVRMSSDPVAVGANARGSLQSVSCTESDCDLATVKILSMDVSPPGVFDTPQLGAEPASFLLPALAEGTATFTVSGDDGDTVQTFSRDLTAITANRVTGGFGYQMRTCPTPVLFGPSLYVDVPFEIWRDDTKLAASNLVPFVVDGATLDLETSQYGTLHLALPTTAGTVGVTSTLDPTFTASAEVIAPTAIDGITLSVPDEPVTILDSGTMIVDVTAGGAIVCGDEISRTAKTLTPDVCKIKAPTPRDEWVEAGMHLIEVTGVRGGTCTITVTNAITGPSATTSFEVTM